MEEIKINEKKVIYKAPEGKVFVHKQNGENLFGEVVMVDFETSEHRIEDFQLEDDEKYLKKIKELKNIIPEEEK